MKFLTASAAVLVLMTVLPAQENTGRGRISGRVVDNSGAAVAEAKIVVRSLQSGFALEALTDKKGRFAVAGMGTGDWRITAAKEGYIAVSAEIQVSQLKPNPPLTVTLSQAAGVEGLSGDEAGRSLLQRGAALLEEGKYDEALAAFDDFAGKYPRVYAVRLGAGAAHLKKGDLDRAESEFRTALEEVVRTHGDAAKDKATALRAYSGLGEIALRRGELAAAQEFFRKALELSPEDQAAAYNVGEILFSNQKADEAIPFFEQAARIRPDWPKPYHRLGIVHLNKGDYDKALEHLRRFLALAPEDPEAENVKAMIAAIEKLKTSR